MLTENITIRTISAIIASLLCSGTMVNSAEPSTGESSPSAGSNNPKWLAESWRPDLRAPIGADTTALPKATAYSPTQGVTPGAPPATLNPKPSSAPPVPGKPRRYELGPGDTLSFALMGNPDSAKKGVAVGPDYRISFLQARGISVRGKTLNEVRRAMEDVLAKFHQEPRVIITPTELGSKRYTILGMIMKDGVYNLERNVTLLEAIAIAGGITVGQSNDTSVELADFSRSFVMRRGQREPVDMESLYQRADMSQNIYLQPEDYIYIASSLQNEFYVLGAVTSPGAKQMDTRIALAGALATGGGLSDKAWPERVLVIRGSLTNPEPHVVNFDQIRLGQAGGFEIQPGDIVYVHTRPWAIAEDLLDMALRTFVQGAAAAAVGGADSVSIGL